jgi:hypothetical protein
MLSKGDKFIMNFGGAAIVIIMLGLIYLGL